MPIQSSNQSLLDAVAAAIRIISPKTFEAGSITAVTKWQILF